MSGLRGGAGGVKPADESIQQIVDQVKIYFSSYLFLINFILNDTKNIQA